MYSRFGPRLICSGFSRCSSDLPQQSCLIFTGTGPPSQPWSWALAISIVIAAKVRTAITSQVRENRSRRMTGLDLIVSVDQQLSMFTHAILLQLGIVHGYYYAPKRG